MMRYLNVFATVAWILTGPAVLSAETDIPTCGDGVVGIECIAMRDEVGPWQIEEVTPPVGTQNALKMSTPSFEDVPGLFGRTEPATFILTCVENGTSVEVRFGENFMSDVGDFGQLIFKVDDGAPIAINLTASPDNTALGIFSGARAIPFIADLFGSERLLVSAQSFTGRKLTSSFSITGIESAIRPLRALCNW
jgi:type VI secretion system protein VasI